MSTDDPTIKLPEKRLDTQPGVEAVLERISALDEKLSGEIASLRVEVERLSGEVENLRATTEKGFRLIDRRFEQLLGLHNKLYGEVRDIDDRVGELEKKVS